MQADRAKLDALQAAGGPGPKGASVQELDELSKYVGGLSYLNELE